MNVPNIITLLRIFLIPVFVVVYLLPVPWRFTGAAAIFGIAALSDWLDGYLARRLGQTTALGAFLDPVADKLIVVAALVLLVHAHHEILLTLPAGVIVGREILISALREWMAEINRRGLVKVVWVGKLKTVLQMVAMLVLLANPPDLSRPFVVVGYVLIYAAAVLTLWSMVLYLRAAWPALRMDTEPGPERGP